MGTPGTFASQSCLPSSPRLHFDCKCNEVLGGRCGKGLGILVWGLIPAGVGAGSTLEASAPLLQGCAVAGGALALRSEQQHSPAAPGVPALAEPKPTEVSFWGTDP